MGGETCLLDKPNYARNCSHFSAILPEREWTAKELQLIADMERLEGRALTEPEKDIS